MAKASYSFAVLAASLVLGSASGAQADTGAASSGDPKVEARSRFDRGIRLFDEGDFGSALAEFRRAYDIAPHPAVLYNVGLAYAAVGNAVGATDTLDKLLLDPGGLSPDQLTKARRIHDEQVARVAEIDVTSAVAGARVEVDNVEVATLPLTAPIRITSGTHIVGVHATGFAPSRKSITVAGRTKTPVAFELAPVDGRLAHLAVTTHLPGADLVANGEVIAKTPLAASITLAPGKYHVELKRAGYTTATTDVVLGDAAKGEVTLEPEEDAGRAASDDSLLELRPSEPGAVVFLDGKLRGAYGAALRVPAGPHRLKVERAGFYPSERDVNLETGRPITIPIRLQPTTETRAAYDSGIRSRRTFGYILTGAGIVIAGASAGFLGYALGKKSDAQALFDDINTASTRGGGGRCDPMRSINSSTCLAEFDGRTSELSTAKTQTIIGFVGVGVGAAALVTGVVLLLTGDDPHKYDKDKDARDHVRTPLVPLVAALPGGGMFGVTGRF